MAIDFRLNYLQGINNYVDIFLETGAKGIFDNTTALKYSTLEVDIPATQENIQTIALNLTPQQQRAVAAMYLVSTDEQAKIDYGTISQYEINGNNMIVTRLYSFPKGPIRVKLLFKERGTQS